jgi:uncharacterized membrane protein
MLEKRRRAEMRMRGSTLAFLAALTTVQGFSQVSLPLRPLSSHRVGPVHFARNDPPQTYGASKRWRGLQRLQMSEDSKTLLGSKRLQYIREMLKQDPASLDGTKTLMGSRRMATAFSTLVHGVQDTPAADPKTECIAPSDNIQKKGTANVASQAATAGQVEDVAMTDSVEKSIEIDATPQLCYQVAAKLDDYPKWVASLESVEVLEAGSDGLANQAKFAVGAFGQTLDYTLQYTHEVPQKLSWKAVAGSVKALVGSYSFEALDGGKRTRVTYKLALDPGFSIPSMIKKASTKLIVSTALSDLRKYTEKPATKELIQGMLESRGSSDTAPAAVDAGAQKEEQKEEVPMTVAEKVQGLKAVLNDAPLSTSTYARNKNPWDV